MTDIRKPPLPESVRFGIAGQCKWCAQPILYPAGDKKAGEPDLRRYWHHGPKKGEPDCLHEFKIVTDPSYARAVVFERDKGKCHDCGTICEPIVTLKPWCVCWGERPAGIVLIHTAGSYNPGWGLVDRNRMGIVAAGPFAFVEFTERTTWELEHDFPLWLVDRTKPFEEIIRYWQLGNLLTRCIPCHKAKSADEAAARAKGKRIRGETGQGPKRRIQSAGFRTDIRRKINGSTERRVGSARMA